VILAGDIGGTKTVLGSYEPSPAGLRCVRENTYPSSSYDSLEAVITDYLRPHREAVEAACFGIAGPVVAGRGEVTNLPWIVEERRLSQLIGARVGLLNDLEATALGMLSLAPEEFVQLNPDAPAGSGNMAVIAAGTGLGEAMLYWDSGRYRAIATEGGHSDFAPNDAAEDALLAYLRSRLGGHVSYERVLSGAGLVNVYHYLRDSHFAPESLESSERVRAGEDPARVISSRGLGSHDPLCREALRMFARIYGAEAGNLALKCLARGGVLVGGGIAPKILPALDDGEFMRGFTHKGRFSGLLASLPVRVALNPHTALLGAAHHAASLTTDVNAR
jgi:glucokinase